MVSVSQLVKIGLIRLIFVTTKVSITGLTNITPEFIYGRPM